MVHAKNYETVSTFVEVMQLMQRKPWPLFSGHGVYMYIFIYISSSEVTLMY